MLTRDEISGFERFGFVRLSGVFTEADATRMCRRVWAALAERYGIREDAPETWTVEEPRHLQSLGRAGVFDALGWPRLIRAVDDLLAPGAWQRSDHWGSPLIRFPRDSGAWDVPHAQWHIDWPARGPSRPLFGLRVLAFLASVLPRGGGTVVLAGSHHLVARLAAAGSAGSSGHSSRVRAALMRAHPWLRDLGSRDTTGDRIARFMGDGASIDGIDVRVVELTGAPGDVVLFHPWLFHAPAPNRLALPRMMIGHNLNTASGVARYAPAGTRGGLAPPAATV